MNSIWNTGTPSRIPFPPGFPDTYLTHPAAQDQVYNPLSLRVVLVAITQNDGYIGALKQMHSYYPQLLPNLFRWEVWVSVQRWRKGVPQMFGQWQVTVLAGLKWPECSSRPSGAAKASSLPLLIQGGSLSLQPAGQLPSENTGH